MGNDEKVCPRCAETVKSAAAVCRFCNYEFGAPSQSLRSVTPEVPKKKSRFMVGCLWVVGVVFVLGIIGNIIGPPKDTATTSEAADKDAPETADVQVTAVELAAAYEANEVAAQQEYGNKTVDVTGRVSGVTLDFMSNPVIQFTGTNQFLPVQAQFDKGYAKLISNVGKGMNLTVRCKSITEVVSAPMLSDCRIVEVHKS